MSPSAESSAWAALEELAAWTRPFAPPGAIEARRGWLSEQRRLLYDDLYPDRLPPGRIQAPLSAVGRGAPAGDAPRLGVNTPGATADQPWQTGSASAPTPPLDAQPNPLQVEGAFGPWRIPEGTTAEDWLSSAELDRLDQAIALSSPPQESPGSTAVRTPASPSPLVSTQEAASPLAPRDLEQRVLRSIAARSAASSGSASPPAAPQEAPETARSGTGRLTVA